MLSFFFPSIFLTVKSVDFFKKNTLIEMQNGNIYLFWYIKYRNQICMLRHNIKTVYFYYLTKYAKHST